MIIEALMTVIYNVINALAIFELPQLPEEVFDFMSQAGSYFSSGVGILANYLHFPFLVALFGVLVAYEIFMTAWKAIMWVLRKIPFLGIK